MKPHIFLLCTLICFGCNYEYEMNDNPSDFLGTSASCPHVSGVAALILSINPELTQKEVANIIEKSARKLSEYSFTTNSNRLNGTWNNEVGYGLLDAYSALLLAQNSIQNPTHVEFNNKVVSSNQTVSGQSIAATNVIIQSNAKLIFNTATSITINTPFEVKYDSSFEFTISER